MGRNKLQRKFVRQKVPFMSLLLLCTALIGSLLAFQLNSSTAHAASLSGDPLVTVSIDKTRGSSCTEIFRANIGTPQAVTKQISCVPGTIMADVTMLRSQAIAQHEAYVVIPSPQDSAAIHQQYTKQVRVLHASKQATLQSQMSTYALPATACWGDGSASLTWNAYEGTMNSSISFYKSTNCSVVYFGDSQLNTSVALGYDPVVWLNDLYAGYDYGLSDCPDVHSTGHYFHIVSQSAPPGYFYENYLYPGTCSSYVNYEPLWNNIGPIN